MRVAMLYLPRESGGKGLSGQKDCFDLAAIDLTHNIAKRVERFLIVASDCTELRRHGNHKPVYKMKKGRNCCLITGKGIGM